MKRRLARYRTTIKELKKQLREMKCREQYLRHCENPPIIYDKAFLLHSFEFAAKACGHTPDRLRDVIEQGLQSRRNEARIVHPAHRAHGLTPDVFDLDLGFCSVHFSYEPKVVVVRGVSWLPIDETDDGGGFITEPAVDDVFGRDKDEPATESPSVIDPVNSEHGRIREKHRGPLNDPVAFGGCPECGGNDGFLNYGRAHWFYCETHRLTWCIGENWFRCWRLETQKDWDENATFLRTCEVVEPVFPAPELSTHNPQEAK